MLGAIVYLLAFESGSTLVLLKEKQVMIRSDHQSLKLEPADSTVDQPLNAVDLEEDHSLILLDCLDDEMDEDIVDEDKDDTDESDTSSTGSDNGETESYSNSSAGEKNSEDTDCDWSGKNQELNEAQIYHLQLFSHAIRNGVKQSQFDERERLNASQMKEGYKLTSSRRVVRFAKRLSGLSREI
ncbi:hypothetical protein DFJ73DRAFT_766727 [Zopfochytrium polystomum]|nr:hypothetical protein DFJ73DRAFT_766727 [Zopfochytrium polystomum]